jgi:hypothetical protein
MACDYHEALRIAGPWFLFLVKNLDGNVVDKHQASSQQHRKN